MAICANKTRPQERAQMRWWWWRRKKRCQPRAADRIHLRCFFFGLKRDRSSNNSIATMFCVLVSEILFSMFILMLIDGELWSAGTVRKEKKIEELFWHHFHSKELRNDRLQWKLINTWPDWVSEHHVNRSYIFGDPTQHTTYRYMDDNRRRRSRQWRLYLIRQNW